MDGQVFVGSRIRQRRIDLGLRQADVAANAEISASYLNLIEHNKRRIGGKLLARLADILGASPDALTLGGDAGVLDGMRTAASRYGRPVEMDRAEDIAARFPGWSALIADQEAQISTLEREVQALSDRMGHDPALADALHDVISSVTAIRATAGILVSGDRVDEDWQQRFHANLHADSQRLTEQSKSLVAYLDQPGQSKDPRATYSVLEAAEQFIAKRADIFLAFDEDPNAQVESIMTSQDVSALSDDVQKILRRRLMQQAADAAKLPFEDFLEAAVACDADPAILADQFHAELPQVFRRLAYLPNDNRLPPRGLAVCDMAGVMTVLKPTLGFRLNRRSDSCPLWPLFSALRQIGQPVRQEVVLPSATAPRLLCFAQAEAMNAKHFDTPLQVESTMLVIADPRPGLAPEVLAGTSCRICPRQDCPSRREPALMHEFL